MNLRIGVVAAVVSLLLVGCASTPEPEPSSEPSLPSAATARAAPSPTASPTPTVEPTPVVPMDPADPSTWVIGFDAVGPLVPGMTPDAALATAVGYDSESYDGCPVIFANRSGYPSLALTYWPDNVVNRIIVRWKDGGAPTLATSPKTTEGIGIGSPAADFSSAYPDAQIIVDQGDSFRVWAVGNNAGRYLLFALTDNIVHSIDVTSEPTFGFELC